MAMAQTQGKLLKHRTYPLVNQHNYGNSPFLMGKLPISMAILNSYVSLSEGIENLVI
jgi:hypothetical protein